MEEVSKRQKIGRDCTFKNIKSIRVALLTNLDRISGNKLKRNMILIYAEII